MFLRVDQCQFCERSGDGARGERREGGGGTAGTGASLSGRARARARAEKIKKISPRAFDAGAGPARPGARVAGARRAYLPHRAADEAQTQTDDRLRGDVHLGRCGMERRGGGGGQREERTRGSRPVAASREEKSERAGRVSAEPLAGRVATARVGARRARPRPYRCRSTEPPPSRPALDGCERRETMCARRDVKQSPRLL